MAGVWGCLKSFLLFFGENKYINKYALFGQEMPNGSIEPTLFL